MASIESYDTRAGRRYRVQYRTPDRRLTSKRGFKRKLDAQRFVEDIEVSKRAGEYVQPSRGRVTVAEAAVHWLEMKRAATKASTWNSIETSWRVHVAPRWAAVRLSDITATEVEAWVTEMRQRSGATVVLRNYGTLASILDSAVKDRRLLSNPARAVGNLPVKRRSHRTYLSHSQVEQLADASGQHRVLVLVLAYCGLRWGEAIALRVEDVDLARGRINVRRNAVQVNMQMHEGTPKTGETRTVPVPQFLCDELSGQVEGKDMGSLVFAGRDGYLRRPVSTSGWFAKAIIRSGVPTIPIHGLRHCAASMAVSAGANVKVIQRMLGHSSAAMTLDTYSDLFDDDLDIVADALDEQRSRNVAKNAQASTVNDV